jgi:hypothetical protein
MFKWDDSLRSTLASGESDERKAEGEANQDEVLRFGDVLNSCHVHILPGKLVLLSIIELN